MLIQLFLLKNLLRHIPGVKKYQRLKRQQQKRRQAQTKTIEIHQLPELTAANLPAADQQKLPKHQPELKTLARQSGQCSFLIEQLSIKQTKVYFRSRVWYVLLFTSAVVLNSRVGHIIVPKQFFWSVRQGFVMVLSVGLVFLCEQGIEYILIHRQKREEATKTQERLEKETRLYQEQMVAAEWCQGKLKAFQNLFAQALKRNFLTNYILLGIAAMLTTEAIAVISGGIENRQPLLYLLGLPILAICFTLGCGWFKAFYLSWPKHQQEIITNARQQLGFFNLDETRQDIVEANTRTQSIINQSNPHYQEQEAMRQQQQAQAEKNDLFKKFSQDIEELSKTIEEQRITIQKQIDDCRLNPPLIDGEGHLRELEQQLHCLKQEELRRTLPLLQQYQWQLRKIGYQFSCQKQSWYQDCQRELQSIEETIQDALEQSSYDDAQNTHASDNDNGTASL